VAAAGGGTSDTGALWLGIIGIGVGVLALAGVGLLWSSRPAELPPDGPEDGHGR
jgi:hypothetical protein